MTGTVQGRLVAGRYRLLRVLAAGGLSQVWLAADELVERRVVVKQSGLPDGLSEQERSLVRGFAVAEARGVARIDHPRVVRVLDVVLDDGDVDPWIVMEFLPSRSLSQVVAESGRLSPVRAAQIGLAVLEGLAAAGELGLLHLDVKPGNVLVCADGRVVLNDFGPVVSAAGVAALSEAAVVLGSAKYVAPERLFDNVSSAASDLWSLGATLYFAVEGRPPYGRASTVEMLRAVASEPPDPVEHAGALAAVIKGLLQRDPAVRWDAERTAAALRAVAGSPVEPEPEPVAGRRSRVRVVVAALAAVLVAGGVVAGVVSSRGGDPGSAARQVAAVPRGKASAVVLPAGYVWWTSPQGWRVAVGRDWKRTAGPVFEAGAARVRVSQWLSPPADLAGALLAQESGVRIAEYRRIRIESTPSGVVWEYLYADASAGAMRSELAIVRVNGRTYRVQWWAPRAQWADGLGSLAVVLATVGTAPGD